MTYPKRLIEVDLPIARISAHARREKSIRHGHISTLHIWWARRPLAACRAVICAALWPDPGDPLCPRAFREAAIGCLTAFAKRVNPDKLTEECRQLQETLSDESRGRWEALAAGTLTLDPGDDNDGFLLRMCLLDFIADFANWDNSTVPAYLETARRLTGVAHQSLSDPAYLLPAGCADALLDESRLNAFLSSLDSQLSSLPRPLVVDPFAGGGSIPLEALRVGADAFASDLNPVAVLLNKVVLEYIPKYGNAEITMQDADGKEVTFHGLAEAVRYWGNWVKEQAERELAEFYPKDPDGSTPIAYLWARTIVCEGPQCGTRVPMVGSLWLGKKPHRPFALRIRSDRSKKVEFEVFSPERIADVGPGTTQRGSATCPVCGFTTPVKSVARQLSDQKGGARHSTLFCVVTTRHGERGRFYREANPTDLRIAAAAAAALEMRCRDTLLPSVPNEPLPPPGTLGFRVQRYGIQEWGDLFTARQALALVTIANFIQRAGEHCRSVDEPDIADAIQVLLAFTADKIADYGSSLASWSSPASQETVRQTFARMALPMVWDFAEAYPFADSSGGWFHNLEFLLNALGTLARTSKVPGQASAVNAAEHALPDDCAGAVVTDPPYYDAIPYADLSDFFLVWLKRSLAGSRLANELPSLAPKDNECVVDTSKGHDYAYFQRTMASALAEARRYAAPNAIGVVVFAHKSTSGWEAQLTSLIDSGWMISASWPIDTERQGRVRANASAALASSIHLVCRPREDADGNVTESIGEWRDVLGELPKRIHEWMPRLAAEGVVGADAIFACLGPALEIFSRYSRVEKANGEQATLREYLEFVWAAVSTEALSLIFKEADASGLEPDARLTAMWLWTIGGGTGNGNGTKKPTAEDAESAEENDGDDDAPRASASSAVKGFTLEYDAARKIAQGLGVHLEQCESLVEVKSDKARLLPVAERTQHLFGKSAAASAAAGRKSKKKSQRSLFEELGEAEAAEAGWTEIKGPPPGTTVLDRVHQSMILFAANRGELLKRFLVEDGVGKDARFWKLADNLNKLYPPGTEERRWIEGVLARKKGLGL